VRAVLARHELAPELPSFSALRERRQRRSQRQMALGAMLLGAVAVVGMRLLHREEAAPSMSAELNTSPSSPEPVIAEAEPPVPPALSAQPVPRAVRASSARARVAPSVARVDRAKLAQPAIAEASPAPSGGGARACAELARRGEALAALACYEQLSSGSGMTAELALFEQARLEGKALRHPERALEILDNYRRRFPSGSLRAEVMLARIDWLLTRNERQRALESVDEALGSGLLRERTAELERLRSSLTAVDAQPAPR